jgi:hypothetical protein
MSSDGGTSVEIGRAGMADRRGSRPGRRGAVTNPICGAERRNGFLRYPRYNVTTLNDGGTATITLQGMGRRWA